MTHSPLERISESMQRAGESLDRAAKALGEFCREFAVCVSVICANYAQILEYMKLPEAKTQEALEEAPPRVRHLAKHGKKHRTRKKNINRALREYRRRKT